MEEPDPYTFIETYTGKHYRFQHPAPEMICKEDIAHALSRICRFTGHVHDFYSVASHSLLVAALVPLEAKLYALLHDATEAYVGDVSSPLKKLLGDVYAEYEGRAQLAIAKHFNIDFQPPAIVKLADSHALYLEAKYNFNRHPSETPSYWYKFRRDGFPDFRPGSFGSDIATVEKVFLNAIERYSSCEPHSLAL